MIDSKHRERRGESIIICWNYKSYLRVKKCVKKIVGVRFFAFISPHIWVFLSFSLIRFIHSHNFERLAFKFCVHYMRVRVCVKLIWKIEKKLNVMNYNWTNCVNKKNSFNFSIRPVSHTLPFHHFLFRSGFFLNFLQSILFYFLKSIQNDTRLIRNDIFRNFSPFSSFSLSLTILFIAFSRSIDICIYIYI